MRVLVVVHGFPPLAEAGAEIYAHRHASALARAGALVTVLARESTDAAPDYRVRTEARDGLDIRWLNNTFRSTRGFSESYDNPAIRRIAAALIDEIAPDVAHVHHLTGLSTTIVDELDARHVPVVMTLHDYWLLCHRGQLLDLDLARCAGPVPASCARCIGPAAAFAGPVASAAPRVRHALARLPPAPTAWLRRATGSLAAISSRQMAIEAAAAARIVHMRRMGDKVRAFLAPSAHMRARATAFGLAPERVHLWPNGVDHAPFEGLAKRQSRTLRIGFLGSLMVSKGPLVLLDAFDGLPAGRATLTLVGRASGYHGDQSYPALLEPRLQRAGVVWRGAVPQRGIPEALGDLDVLVVPSIWEENSPLVIQEAFLAGLPVIASRVGGIPEAVSDGINGLLVEPGSVNALRLALVRLLDEPDLLPKLRAGIPEVRPIEEDAAAAMSLYDELRTSVLPPKPDRVCAVVLNYHTPDETLLAVRSLAASETPFADIVVVDNASDGSCRGALANGAASRIIENASNVGFPAGVNQGIRAALDRGASHVMLVNSDAIVPPDMLGELLSALDERPDAGLVGPVILDRARPGLIASAGMRYDRDTGRMRHRAAGRLLNDTALEAWSEVDGISGCAMLVRAEVFAQVGLFPEEYFFSFEDLAFCLRARDAGFTSGVVAGAVAYHEGGRSMGATSVRRLYYAARNHLHLAATMGAGGSARHAFRTTNVVALNLAHAMRAPGGSIGSRILAVLRGVRDHARGRYGPDPTG